MADQKFLLNRLSLDFLFEQVDIGIDYTQLTNALDPRGVRETAGTNQNLVGHGDFEDPATGIPGPNAGWGAADQPFLRISQDVERTGIDLDGNSTDYAQATGPNGILHEGNVVDASPRIIANLVTNSWTSTDDPDNPTDLGAPISNPAADALIADGRATYDVSPNLNPALPDNGLATAFVPNVGPLGAAAYNNWFVFFGQFFDHGLDFIKKQDAGYVMIPLTEGDPLFSDAAGAQNMMMISRAKLENPDTDFDGSGVLLPEIEPIYNNNTALLIDQSQTYGSHPSVNAFLREYNENGVVTGRVTGGGTIDPGATEPVDGWTVDNPPPLSSQSAGLATWADIKANALRIGITLTNEDVLDAPALLTDAKGELIRDVDGNAQLAGGGTGHAFLLDINPRANPHSLMTDAPLDADADDVVNSDAAYNPFATTYDDELLDAHYVVGDGRANENFALTAVHEVWHDEHNFQVKNLKTNVLRDAVEANDLDAINRWLVDNFLDQTALDDLIALNLDFTSEELADVAAVDLAIAGLSWDGEKLFQGARIVTETEYNHVAVDEYVGRLVADLGEFVSFTTDINPVVSLEFSQAVFRLGHSMLTENIEIANPETGEVTDSVALFDAFLNPEGFAEYGAGAIAEGAINQIANEVDEFVTPALQQTLVGQPLDLAAINIARGRDLGLPTWNEFRDQIFQGLTEGTSNSPNAGALAPYQSWTEVGAHLRNPETLVNLIAAYGENGEPGDPGTYGIKAFRDAGDLDGARTAAALAMTDDVFMGGLPGAPIYDPVTGTWSIPETGAGDQGFWNIDLWLGGLAERPLIDGILGTTFSYVFLDFAQRMQDGDRFYYLFRLPPGADIGQQIISTKFSDIVARNSSADLLNGDAFAVADRYYDANILNDAHQYFTSFVDDNGTPGDTSDDTTHHYFSGYTALLDDADPDSVAATNGHIVIIGGDGNDNLTAGDGDDTLHGGDGNDYLNGSQGNDHIFGGAGDDFIIDDENDDFIRGGTGNDTVFAGKGGLDTVFGEEGNDELHGGDGIDELFGGDGDDALFGDGDTDVIVGGSGNDYVEGGDSVDEIWGGDGNDILLGGVGDDHLNGDGGSDLLFGGLGAAANDGDRFVGDLFPVIGGVFPTQEGFGLQTGEYRDVVSYEGVGIDITADLQTSNENGTGSNLIDTYAFVDGLVGSRFDDNLTGASDDTTTTNGFDNLLVGGAGDDVLIGLGGDDEIFGDRAVVNNDLSVADSQDITDAIVDSHGLNRIDTGDVVPDGGNPEAWLGHVLGDNGDVGTADVAVFSGELPDYTIIQEGPTAVRLIDDRGIDSTEVGDVVADVELFRFSDGDGGTIELTFAEIANLPPTDIQWNGAEPAGNGVPGAGLEIANLSVTDDPISTSWTYNNNTIPNVAVSAAGVVTALGPLAPNQVNTGEITVTDDGGLDYVETFNVRTDAGGANTINGNPDTDIIYARGGADTVSGLGGDDVLYGQGGADTLSGGEGNDAVYGGAGNDTINWSVGDGRDVVDGGANGGPGDTFEMFGDASDETIDIYGPTMHPAGYTGTAEIVVTRSVGAMTEIIGELTDIEELIYHSGGGTDTISLHGAFIGVLNPDTITINAQDGNVMVDVTEMTSDEHIVVNVGNGTYEIVGDTNGNVEVNTTGSTGGTGTSTTPVGGIITGTETALFGTTASDVILGTDDNMVIFADNGDDIVTTGNENAIVFGGGGNDLIDSYDGNDIVFGDDDIDTILTGSGNDKVWGGAGGDLIDAGSGNDIVFGGSGEDDISGGAGNDRLWGDEGADRIDGGDGDDRIEGGTGADTLIGGEGNDTFVFRSVADADGDRIGDFAPGDRIDLHFLDANYSLDGNNSFTLQAGGTFTAAGELIVHTDSSGNTAIEGNTDADLTTAEFSLVLDGDRVDELLANNSIIL